MRRMLSLMLSVILVMSLCGLSLAEEGSPDSEAAGWPEMTIAWADIALRDLGDESMRHQAYYGPGKEYATAGAYKPYKVKNARSLLREGDYVLVELDYPTVGKRCVYFKKSMLREAPEEQVQLEAHPAKIDIAVIPVLGPGDDYDRLIQKMPPEWVFHPEDWPIDEWRKIYGDNPGIFEVNALVETYGGSDEIEEATDRDEWIVVLDPGTEISVFFETDGWVYTEFTCGTGLVRAWLPSRFVSAK